MVRVAAGQATEALEYTDVGDAAVIGTSITRGPENAVTLSGEEASSLDKAFAYGGAIIPFVSGSFLKKVGKGLGLDKLFSVDQGARKTTKNGFWGSGGGADGSGIVDDFISTEPNMQNSDYVSELAQELKESGNSEWIFNEIEVVNVEGTLFIVDGHHRVEAALEAGYQGSIPFRVIDLKDTGFKDIEDLYDAAGFND